MLHQLCTVAHKFFIVDFKQVMALWLSSFHFVCITYGNSFNYVGRYFIKEYLYNGADMEILLNIFSLPLQNFTMIELLVILFIIKPFVQVNIFI